MLDFKEEIVAVICAAVAMALIYLAANGYVIFPLPPVLKGF